MCIYVREIDNLWNESENNITFQKGIKSVFCLVCLKYYHNYSSTMVVLAKKLPTKVDTPWNKTKKKQDIEMIHPQGPTVQLKMWCQAKQVVCLKWIRTI